MTTTYTYDSNGLRTSKTTGDDVTEYTYLGSSLVYQVTNKGQSDEESLYFYYDEAGIAAFSYKSAEHPTDNGLYYYIRNPQGDILGIVDRTGTLIARYDYSAYGEYKSVWMPEEVPSAQIQRNNRVRNANPFDYRGYYYDTETGLYYCQSRYYDPEVDRWLNADSVLIGIGGDFRGNNLFTYCINNPVNFCDPMGYWPDWDVLFNSNFLQKMIQPPMVDTSLLKRAVSRASVNHVNRIHVTTPEAMLDGGTFIGKVGVSATVTEQDNEPGLLYTYEDIGNDEIKTGAGVNIGGWLGTGIGSSSEGNVFINAQVTPWVHGEVSIGYDGVGAVLGVDVGNTSYDFEVKGGWPLIVVFAMGGAMGSFIPGAGQGASVFIPVG